MSVQSTMTRFAAVWANYGDDANGQTINEAFAQLPRQLWWAQLPAVLSFPGAATYDVTSYGERIVREPRAWRCVLALSPITGGNQQTGQLDIEPYFDSVRDYFLARPGLEDDTAVEPQDRVLRAKLTGDGGYVIFEWPSGNEQGEMGLFHAIEFTFEVEELTVITHQD